MNEFIDSLDKARVFPTLDANSGYWQIDIDRKDIDKTAFVTHHGLFKYTRMPFGLKNAPVTFQCTMDIIPASVKWQHALVYLDDIHILSKTLEVHLKHIDEVLRLLMKAGVTIKLKKCPFNGKTIDYSGHVTVPGKQQKARKTTEALETLQHFTNLFKIRSFLEGCDVYRRFGANSI